MTQQQYTPVSWQDETTSQQGTLINAERLNQMQTAHHFADGLEETDTVPTADPGVDYHKIVYCTADNTLYRWDGTQWTADIDDPTRELLEEHLADHDNPHQVTKAQIGLGNADNTSDADKPISTATQTALNAKADKSDTYTKAQVDTALATKADKATTYTKTETDTLLGAKADDNAVVHLAGAETIPGAKTFTANRGVALKATQSYNTFEVSSKGFTNNIEAKVYTSDGSAADQHFVIGTSYSNASREVWHAIAYAPRATRGDTSEAQTEMRLSMNINNNNTGEAYLSFGRNDGVSAPDLVLGKFANGAWAPTMVNDALDAYAPMVRTTGNQTIAGVKTFTSITWATALGVDKGICGPTTATTGTIYLMATIDSLPSNEGCVFTIRGGLNNQNHIFAKYRIINASSGGLAIEAIEKAYTSPYQEPLLYIYNDGGTVKIYGTTISWTTPRLYLDYWETQGYMYADLNRHTLSISSDFSAVTLPAGASAEIPTYPMANTVHKTGDETITGSKTFSAPSGMTIINIDGSVTSGITGVLRFRSAGTLVSGIYYAGDGSTTVDLLGTKKAFMVTNQRAYDPTHTTDVATIGTLDAYTPMVRTTGNQVISGNKTINDRRDRAVYIATVPTSYSYYTVDRVQHRGALSGDVLQTFLNKMDGNSTGSNGNGAGVDLYAKDANGVQYSGRLALYINPDTKTAKLFIRVSGGTDTPVTQEIASVSIA